MAHARDHVWVMLQRRGNAQHAHNCVMLWHGCFDQCGITNIALYDPDGRIGNRDLPRLPDESRDGMLTLYRLPKQLMASLARSPEDK